MWTDQTRQCRKVNCTGSLWRSEPLLLFGFCGLRARCGTRVVTGRYDRWSAGLARGCAFGRDDDTLAAHATRITARPPTAGVCAHTAARGHSIVVARSDNVTLRCCYVTRSGAPPAPARLRQLANPQTGDNRQREHQYFPLHREISLHHKPSFRGNSNCEPTEHSTQRSGKACRSMQAAP